MDINCYTEDSITLEFGDEINEETNKEIVNLRRFIDDQEIDGIIETIISYTRLVINFDALKTSAQEIISIIKHTDLEKIRNQEFSYKLVEIPVCYDEEFGPDLALFQENGLAPDEVIQLHSNKEYLVYMLGFMPGFVYLGGLDEKLFKARLDTPRKNIPAGSVGIGGKQTGIYPFTSPGGWNLLGRTPLKVYDTRRGDETIPYEAGDRLIFKGISKEEFEAISAQVEEGTYKIQFSIEGE